MAKKLWKWLGFLGGVFAVSAVVIAVPFIASSSFWSVYRSEHADEYESLRYQIPENLGSKVAESAFAYATNADRISLLQGDNKRFLDTIEGTYVFAGGNDFFSDWDSYQSFRGLVGLYEENVRWALTARGGTDPSYAYSSLGRFCINISKPNQTLKDINDNYDFKVRNLDPKNVVTIVGAEYANTDNINKTLDQFETDLRTFVQNSLKLRNNTANLILIKHWKIPNPDNDPKIAQFNDNVEKLNIRANRILSELTADQIPRVLLVDDENLFLNLDYYYYDYFDSNLNLTRIGNNEVAKSILATMKPYVATTGQIWTDANWVNFSNTHLNALPLDWNTLEEKNTLDIEVKQTVDTSVTPNVATLTVSFPDGGVSPGDNLKWLLQFTDPTVKIEDYSVVNQNNEIVINNIFVNPTSTSYTLLVYDKDGHPFNIYNGTNLNQSTPATNTTTNSLDTGTTQTLTVAQQKFMDKFNNPNKPLVWTFIGDSVDHGANANQGFDDFEEVVEKSVKTDWKRYDDIFINAAQSGNFSNRAVDPYQIESTITKYHPDVLSIGLGVSDGVNIVSNGQATFTNEQQYIANMKTLIEAAKAANPDVIVVINAVNPTSYTGRQTIPTTYNGYLNTAFGPNATDNPYSDFVIYNSKVYDDLNTIETHYTYTINDSLFLYSDKLHPSGNANLIKGRDFLESLGVDVQNSYLDNYMMEQFVWWTGTTTNPIGEVQQVATGNKVVPKINPWASALPLGGSASNINLGNVFLTYKNTEEGNQRTYFLNTDYGDYTNKYVIYLEDGTYTVDAWAVGKIPLSSSAQYGAKAPTGELTITSTPTTTP